MLRRISIIRLLNKKFRRRIRLLGDLQGHRIRIGELVAPIELKKRDTLWLTQQKIKGTHDKIPFDYRGSLKAIKSSQHIFIDDGNIALEVIGRTKHSLKVRVIVGGLLKEHKGVNIPEAGLEFGSISQKDVQDILFCERHNIEYIAQSFVHTKKDILDVKDVLKESSQYRIIAKIENKDGIKNINEIIKVSNAL